PQRGTKSTKGNFFFFVPFVPFCGTTSHIGSSAPGRLNCTSNDQSLASHCDSKEPSYPRSAATASDTSSWGTLPCCGFRRGRFSVHDARLASRGATQWLATTG